MLHLPAKVGPPASEIIVHVNDRDPGLFRTLFQAQNLSRHGPGMAQELVRLRKIEIFDDVDQEQCKVRFIRRAAVQVVAFSWHLPLLATGGFLPALLAAFLRAGLAALLPPARAALLSAFVRFVPRGPGAFLGFLLGDTLLFVALLDVLRFSFLFGRVT